MKLAPRETIEQATIRMVTSDKDWPCWPILPLKNRKLYGSGLFGIVGFLCAPAEAEPPWTVTYFGITPQLTGKSPAEYSTITVLQLGGVPVCRMEGGLIFSPLALTGAGVMRPYTAL